LGLLVTGAADGLAREAAGQKVDSFDSAPIDGGDVSKSGNIGPVPGEDSLAELVPFDLEAAFPAGSLEAEVDAADARKEAAERRHFTRGLLPLLV
jgi:hypothetical protein